MASKRATRRPLPPPDWRFNSFPTYFALAIGMMSGLLIGISGSIPVFYVAFIACVFGISFSIVHYSTRTFMANRVRRATSRAEDDERDRREYALRAAAAAANPAPAKRRRRRR